MGYLMTLHWDVYTPLVDDVDSLPYEICDLIVQARHHGREIRRPGQEGLESVGLTCMRLQVSVLALIPQVARA